MGGYRQESSQEVSRAVVRGELTERSELALARVCGALERARRGAESSAVPASCRIRILAHASRKLPRSFASIRIFCFYDLWGTLGTFSLGRMNHDDTTVVADYS